MQSTICSDCRGLSVKLLYGYVQVWHVLHIIAGLVHCIGYGLLNNTNNAKLFIHGANHNS